MRKTYIDVLRLRIDSGRNIDGRWYQIYTKQNIVPGWYQFVMFNGKQYQGMIVKLDGYNGVYSFKNVTVTQLFTITEEEVEFLKWKAKKLHEFIDNIL